ncbi:Aminopeptidase M1 [Glycine soja]|uniref:Aminopeptidase M1 n=1 Tax=Glycine soja TaxID=3848 RepID=A0A445GH70_GLYSO|nr:Aminopeptidase M1 [Glycine soja]
MEKLFLFNFLLLLVLIEKLGIVGVWRSRGSSWKNSGDKLGWDSISGEDHSISLLRGEVFQALATFDHDKTQQEALRRFQILLDGRNTSLPPANIRRVAYVAVMRNTTTENRTGLESLLSFYRSSIASSADPNVVIEVLNLLLSDAIPDQDIIYVLAGISNEGSETAWRWLKTTLTVHAKKPLQFKVRAVVTVRNKIKEDFKETMLKHLDAINDSIGTRNVVLELISIEIDPKATTRNQTEGNKDLNHNEKDYLLPKVVEFSEENRHGGKDTSKVELSANEGLNSNKAYRNKSLMTEKWNLGTRGIIPPCLLPHVCNPW